MEKIIAANWKMNNDFEDIPKFVKFVKKNAKRMNNLVVCVPSVMIKTFAEMSKNICETGAENCYFEKSGAFTGEVSPCMIKNAGAKWVIIGHSERRAIFGEENVMLNKKLKAALNEDLKVIYCIGETLEEKSKYKSVLKKQILEGFDGVSDFSNIVVAYEPVWAIGTGKVATISDIDKVHKYIQNLFEETYKVVPQILYGGSVKPTNSAEILALESVGGVLIGGASLKAEDYVAIAKSR